jgi:hypothetical protein
VKLDAASKWAVTRQPGGAGNGDGGVVDNKAGTGDGAETGTPELRRGRGSVLSVEHLTVQFANLHGINVLCNS